MLKSPAIKRSAFAIVVSLVLVLLSPPTGFASASSPKGQSANALTFSPSDSREIEVGSAKPFSGTDATNVTLASFVEISSKAVVSNSATLVRPNQEYSIHLHAFNNSGRVAGITISVALSGVALVENTKMISIDGGNSVSSYPKNLTVVTDQSGVATISLRTIGFEEADVLFLNSSWDGVASAPLVLVTSAPVYSLTSDHQVYATAPGATTKFSFNVQDQWGVSISGSGYRVRLLQEVDGFTFEKSAGEAPVVSGTADLTLTFLPTALNRSVLLKGVLEKFDYSKNAWVSFGSNSDPIRINVTEEPANFQELPQASAFAEVSYLTSKIEWVSISGTVSVPGSEVSVNGGEGLIFRVRPKSQPLARGLSLRAAADGKYSFEVASLRSGLQTISQKVGAVEAQTFITVAAAPGNAGKSITFDKTSLPAGQTSKLTGTLLDENGNPVQTSGGADVFVSWKGAGFPVGVGPVETDAAGRFSIVILVPATERGSGTIAATYRPQGQSGHSDNIFESQTLTIEKRTAEVSASLSSSNGQWFVQVENGIGLEVTVKVGSRWLKSIASSNSFNLSGRAQVGTTLPIRVWVDGALFSEQRLIIK